MFRGKNVRVREVDEFDFSKVQLVFFAAGPAVTLSFAPRATAAGCALIDLSGALPADQAPQIVPEANPQVLANLSKPFQVSSPSPRPRSWPLPWHRCANAWIYSA